VADALGQAAMAAGLGLGRGDGQDGGGEGQRGAGDGHGCFLPKDGTTFGDFDGGVTSCPASGAVAWWDMVRPTRHVFGSGGMLALAAAAFLSASLWPAVADISTTGTSGIGPFTQAQVDAGRTAYNASCAACHGYDLQNGTHRTPLIGQSFIVGWGQRSTLEYYRYISYRMPYREPGSLAPQTYADIVAYILAANGAQPGSETMTPQSAVRIDTIADGIIRAPVLAGNSQPQ
jgi:hypothetical protein